MKMTATPARHPEDGSTLIEALGSMTLLLVVMAGLLGMDGVATRFTENYGHLLARTSEYGQDKMEQLLALAYGDTASNTAVFPAANSGGTGLAVGGSANPAAPAAGYVDYLDQNGNLLAASGVTAPAGWYYKRVWQVSSPSANLKSITVLVTVARGANNTAPVKTTVVALKSFPF